jgi:hypothetical protein
MMSHPGPQTKPLVMVAGTFQRGKSTLINGLIGHAVAEVGIATTHGWTRYRAGAQGGIEAVSPNGRVLHRWLSAPAPLLQQVDLADIPGFDAGGDQGAADAAVADEALAQADIILHVTNQSGLGGETEREVLRRVRHHQPIVIALQNVFVTCNAAKKAQWLAELEKQLADLGIKTWRLQPHSRALSVNALHLATSAGAAAGDEDHSPQSPEEAARQRKDSGLQPLISFLTTHEAPGLAAVELCKLRRATRIWASERIALLTSHLDNLIKPCL